MAPPTRLQHFGEAARGLPPPGGPPWAAESRAGVGAHRALTYTWSSEAGCLRKQALPPFGAGGLVVRSCTGPSQALAPVRPVEGGSHAARPPNGEARGGSMAGTERASEIRVSQDAVNTPSAYSVAASRHGDRTAGLEVSPVVFLRSRLRRWNRWAGLGRAVAYVLTPEATPRARSLAVATPVHVLLRARCPAE
jgi:hypothetical protein